MEGHDVRRNLPGGAGLALPDDWGFWMRNQTADIAFKIPECSAGAKEGYLLYFALNGLPPGQESEPAWVV
jgi:hypothetical protein